MALAVEEKEKIAETYFRAEEIKKAKKVLEIERAKEKTKIENSMGVLSLVFIIAFVVFFILYVIIFMLPK